MMRKSISLLAAVAVVAGSIAATIAPASAAMSGPPASGSNGIHLVGGGGYDFDGPNRGGRHWNDNRWDNDGWRHRRHHRQHRYHRDSYRPQFFFGFPFAFAPQHRYRHDCFRGRDGRLYCAR